MNSVCVIGRLTADPERRAESVVSFRLAYKQGNGETGYVDVACFGKTADAVEQHKKKGHQVAVAGELRHRTWEQDGAKRQAHSIGANRVDFLGVPSSGTSEPEPSTTADGGEGRTDDGDDIPF